MDLKVFEAKPLCGLQSFGVKCRNLRPFLVPSSRTSRSRSVLLPCSCKLVRGSDSNTERGTDSMGQVQSHLLRKINGGNGLIPNIFPQSTRTLEAIDDEYGGVVINPERLPSNPLDFGSLLHSSLSLWKLKGRKGVWLKLPLEHSDLVPVAVKEGFKYHHAESGYVMMTYWIPEGPCMLPANASHQVGIGGFVLNHNHEVLVVQEKFSPPPFQGFWKIPTGFIHESEEIFTGAVREVKEETGINTEFVEVIAFRHAQNMAFEKSDLFFICMLKPLSTDIEVDDHEILAAKWMPLIEFVEQPLMQEDSMFMKVIDIFLARLGKKYCGLFAHQLVSKFDGRSSTLYYNIVDSQDFNCRGS